MEVCCCVNGVDGRTTGLALIALMRHRKPTLCARIWRSRATSGRDMRAAYNHTVQPWAPRQLQPRCTSNRFHYIERCTQISLCLVLDIFASCCCCLTRIQSSLGAPMWSARAMTRNTCNRVLGCSIPSMFRGRSGPRGCSLHFQQSVIVVSATPRRWLIWLGSLVSLPIPLYVAQLCILWRCTVQRHVPVSTSAAETVGALHLLQHRASFAGSSLMWL